MVEISEKRFRTAASAFHSQLKTLKLVLLRNTRVSDKPIGVFTKISFHFSTAMILIPLPFHIWGLCTTELTLLPDSALIAILAILQLTLIGLFLLVLNSGLVEDLDELVKYWKIASNLVDGDNQKVYAVIHRLKSCWFLFTIALCVPFGSVVMRVIEFEGWAW